MKRLFPVCLAFLFLVAGIAAEGPACASLAKGQQACCQNCPLKMLPKFGDSCCKQGVEKGNAGLVLQRPVKKWVPVTTVIKNDLVIFHVMTVPLSLTREVSSIYLTEEHLLL